MTATSRTLTQAPSSAPRALAARKREVTRDAVVDAVIGAIQEHGLDFSVQAAADRAGVTHRTVYRYFGPREALVDAVADRYETWLASQGIRPPQTVDELLAQVGALFELFDRSPDLVRAVAMHVLAGGQRTARSAARTDQWRRMFKDAAPHLSSQEIEPVFAICRTLAGSVGWYLLRSLSGLSGEESARAVRRTVELLVADLRRRDAAAARRGATRRER